MRESIGSATLYNIIIVFIVVTFAVLAGTMSYSKAFKVNNRIINAIEKYEGYNEKSAAEIDEQLLSIGYEINTGTNDCTNVRKGVALYNNSERNYNPNYEFCIYKNGVDTSEWKGRYFEYGVISYIYIDFPFLGDFVRIPVYGKTRKIFEFEKNNAPIISGTTYSISASYSGSNYTEHKSKIDNKIPVFSTTISTTDLSNYLVVKRIGSDGSSDEITSGNYNIVSSGSSTVSNYTVCRFKIKYDKYVSSELTYYLTNGNCIKTN